MDPWARLHLINRVLESAPLLPFATAWLRRRHIPRAFRPVYYYVAAEAFLYFLDRLSRITIHNNIYIHHLATVLLVLFLTQAYYRLLPQSRVQKAIRPSLYLFLVVAFVDAAFLNGLFSDINTYSHSFGCAILLTLAMIHIARLTLESPLTPLEKQPGFFLSVATLVYCSCSIITYVARNVVYGLDYDLATEIRLDIIVSVPDTFLFAVAMALLAWMFSFFPLSTNPRRALPKWLHYSRWQQRPLRFLSQPFAKQPIESELRHPEHSISVNEKNQ
ncbi:hypothetical protein SAMN00120144_3731 [Hymenobacter roseosalivarius DSM 11622]|uniref:Uncharacterized protein n=1 Tax=Hymenobacter roseosalivarius DSM 11622 TaxID=645990 RepID=A0A1W1VB08_9BACT|nr:hypothetical protein [Hymenobacter roseosalivarius]SMB90380.1 hypothetical protein SAMN00120144_3731 [Hymenobacter roseosalivarius DSM 11622]